MMMTPSYNPSKTQAPGAFQKYHDTLDLFNIGSVVGKAVPQQDDVVRTVSCKPRPCVQDDVKPAKTTVTMPQKDDDKYTKFAKSTVEGESWFVAKTPVDDPNGSGYYEKGHSAPVLMLIILKLQSVLCAVLGKIADLAPVAKTPVDDSNGSGYYEKGHSAPVFMLLIFKLQSIVSAVLGKIADLVPVARTPVEDENGSGYYEKYHKAPVLMLLFFKLQSVLCKIPSLIVAKTPVDDKNGSGYYEKYHSAPVFMLLIFKLQSVVGKAVPALFALFWNSSFCFACIYTLLGLAYILLGGQPSSITGSEKLLNLMSISMEVFGLLTLRHKIQTRNSVQGISGMTMLMYAACYALRIWLNLPDSWNFNVMELELEASFGIFSLLLVLDCLRSIFVTHRSSYQEDLDVLHVKYLIPGCFVLALLLHAQFHTWSASFGYMWSSCLYMDVLALMPQVVMMARGDGKVAAPIAHFVAATFLSRIEDLSDSLFYKADTLASDDYFSYHVVIFFQALHLLIVADFMYYYVKALTSRAGFAKQIDVLEV